MTRSGILAPLLAVLLGATGCPAGDEPDLVRVDIEAASTADGPFTTDRGYDVTLDVATITLGELHFHEPKDVGELTAATPFRWLTGPAVARAHPGHDMSGDVRGELTGTWTIDLLAEPALLGQGTFYEGSYETASFVLARPDGATTLVLTGTADDGSGPHHFDLHADHEQTILGIPFETELDADAMPAVILLVDPAAILAHLDFSELDSDGDGTVTVADEGVSNPLLFGLESNVTYTYEIR